MKYLAAVTAILASLAFAGVAQANEVCLYPEGFTFAPTGVQVAPAGRGVLKVSWANHMAPSRINANNLWLWPQNQGPFSGIYVHAEPTESVYVVNLLPSSSYNVMVNAEGNYSPAGECLSNNSPLTVGVSGG